MNSSKLMKLLIVKLSKNGSPCLNKSAILGNKNYLILFLLLISIFVQIGCVSSNTPIIENEFVVPGYEFCSSNVVLVDSNIIKGRAKWVHGNPNDLQMALHYKYELLDPNNGLEYEFSNLVLTYNILQSPEDQINREVTATYRYCFEAPPDKVAGGVYDVTAKVEFFEPQYENPVAILHIPYIVSIKEPVQ